LTLEVHPDAELEIFAALDWYAERDAALASSLRAEILTAFEDIEAAPGRFPPYLLGTRRCLLRRFPYCVVYDAASQRAIQVLALAHHSREASYWHERVV